MAIGYDSQTSNYGAPAIAYPKPTGTIPTNLAPDNTNTTELVIPMTLTVYTFASGKPRLSVAPLGPLIDVKSNVAFGGSAQMESSMDLPRMTLEGHIDTPSEIQNITQEGEDANSSEFNVPSMIIGGIRMMYADYIIMCWEGRAAVNSGVWSMVNPVWFRDPYGRKFNNPKVLDFTASYVEQVPGRTNFTMSLLVPISQ